MGGIRDGRADDGTLNVWALLARDGVSVDGEGTVAGQSGLLGTDATFGGLRVGAPLTPTIARPTGAACLCWRSRS